MASDTTPVDDEPNEDPDMPPPPWCTCLHRGDRHGTDICLEPSCTCGH